jgi:hypothetical protein
MVGRSIIEKETSKGYFLPNTTKAARLSSDPKRYAL